MKADQVRPELAPPNGTALLCQNLARTAFSDLSDENVSLFKDRLLDMAGCIFGGATVTEDRFFYELLKRQGGAAEAPLFTDAARLPLTSAAEANCVLARANDFGNMYTEIFGEGIASHFGETMIPMGLTLADAFGTSGEALIVNNVAAEDTVARILYTLPVRWPTDMQLVSTAAAAVAARYYALDADQCRTALSYAAANSTTPGNAYYDYSQEFKLHNGESARIGVLSAQIAKAGCWRGFEDPYFGHWGLISSKLPEGELPDLYEKAFSDLGRRYYTETRFKKGPGGIPTTAAGDCGRRLHWRLEERNGTFDPEKIRAVHVSRTSNMRRNYYDAPFALRDHTNALFSYQFAACCALLFGDRRVDCIQTDAIRANRRLVELAENSTMDVFDSPDGQQWICVSVETTDGCTLTEKANYAAAMRDYPTREFLRAKFWSQFRAFGRLPNSVGEEIIRLSERIEALSDMREFTRLLTLEA